MKIAKLIKIRLALILAILFFTLLSTNTYAQETSLSLGYAPTAIYLKLQPGQTYNGEVTFWNLAQRTISFETNVRGFKQIEDFPGTSRILTEQEDENSPYSAAEWFFVEDNDVTIGPNSSYEIKYNITVPENAATGEHHATIFLLSNESSRGNAPGSQALTDLGSGPAILIHVGDEIIERASVQSFVTDKPFYETTPTIFFTKYENGGNTHITPAGDIVLRNFLGQEIDRIVFNGNSQSVLRDNTAKYEDVWESDSILLNNGKLAIGPIEAKLVTTYRSVNPGFAPLSATTNFWVLPYKHILVALAVIIFVYRQTIGKRISERKSADSNFKKDLA